MNEGPNSSVGSTSLPAFLVFGQKFQPFFLRDFSQDIEKTDPRIEIDRWRSFGEVLNSPLIQLSYKRSEEVFSEEGNLKSMFPEIREFLRQNDGISYFLEIKDIISDVFPKITGFETRLQSDPEVENSQWVCIDIAMDAEVEEALQWYNVFTERFVKEIPSEKRELFRIGIDID